MIKAQVTQLAEFLGGTLIGNKGLSINKVTTDSRNVAEGSLFLALKGARFDGHDYIASAVSQGAKAVVTDHKMPLADDISQIIVADTRIALGKLGLFNRLHSKAKVCALTGTCGKTTVKEMIASILSQMGKTISTKGNLNNDIGVPLTLLQIDEDTEYAVIEMGANHPKEIEYSVNLVNPDCVLINNVGAAHLEGFGSLEGVYQAKSEIFDYAMEHNKIAIVNADDAFYPKWCEDYAKVTLLSSGLNSQADICGYDVATDDLGCPSFSFKVNLAKVNQYTKVIEGHATLPLLGKHNVNNALNAIAMSAVFGAGKDSIIKGLGNVKAVAGRLSLLKVDDNLAIIDDAYNASFTAVKASIDALSVMKGTRIFILGDMGELGDYAKEIHQEVGKFAIGKIDYLYAVGELAKFATQQFNALGGKGGAYATKELLQADLAQKINDKQQTMTFAVKGSHAMNMHQVVEYIINKRNDKE